LLADELIYGLLLSVWGPFGMPTFSTPPGFDDAVVDPPLLHAASMATAIAPLSTRATRWLTRMDPPSCPCMTVNVVHDVANVELLSGS
jgi:hypothetical protein